MSRTSAHGIIDINNKCAQLDFFQFLGVSGSGTMKGFFINELGERTGPSFTGTVPSGNGSTNPGNFVSISGAPLPPDAVGFKGQLGIDVYVDISRSAITNNPEFKVNCGNYPKITAGAEVAIGRVAGAEVTTASFNVSNTLSNSSIAINDGTTNTQKLAVSSGGAAKIQGGGTAGSADTAVVTVQGIASGTNIPVSQATASSFNAQVVGNVAAGATDSGNPVKVGGRAINAEITALTAAQRSDLLTDLVGKLIVLPYANPENFTSGVTAADITDTTSTAVIASQGGSLRTYITAIAVSNMHATVATRVDILDGTTVVWSGPAAVAGGGYTVCLPTPIRCTATTAVNAKCGTTGAQVRAAVAGFKGI